MPSFEKNVRPIGPFIRKYMVVECVQEILDLGTVCTKTIETLLVSPEMYNLNTVAQVCAVYYNYI